MCANANCLTRFDCHGAEHTQASVKALLPRLHYFKEGTCIVHHMFGGEVTELVSKAYGDAYLTAHFEVCTITSISPYLLSFNLASC